MSAYNTVGVTIKSELAGREEAVHSVLNMLESQGCKVLLDRDRCEDLPDATSHGVFGNDDQLDLLVVIGGDGTILRAVRELQHLNIPMLSVNMGAVGFLAEIDLHELKNVLPNLLAGEGELDERALLDVTAIRNGKELYNGHVLNEAVISQGSIARLVELKTFVNGEELTVFRADGLIISTPTGSSAYSLAAGGPIVHPKLAATILTPINPHSFSQKPIVIPEHHAVEVEIMTREQKFHHVDISLTLDGQTYITVQSGDRLKVTCSGKNVKFLRRKQDSFYATLRHKLKWGARGE